MRTGAPAYACAHAHATQTHAYLIGNVSLINSNDWPVRVDRASVFLRVHAIWSRLTMRMDLPCIANLILHVVDLRSSKHTVWHHGCAWHINIQDIALRRQVMRSGKLTCTIQSIIRSIDWTLEALLGKQMNDCTWAAIRSSKLKCTIDLPATSLSSWFSDGGEYGCERCGTCIHH